MLEWLLDPAWPEMRATITAVGGLAALAVATGTYTLNSRSKREEQPRLVYSKLVSVDRVPKGSEPEFPEGDDVLVATYRAGWSTSAPLSEHAVLAVVEVRNNSKEVLGPMHVRVEYSDQVWSDSPGAVLAALNPESSARVALLGRNESGAGTPLEGLLTPVLIPSIMFRDSAGRWWKRRGTDRIRLLKTVPRLDHGAAQALNTSSVRTIRLGDGFAPSYITSKPVRWWFEAAARVPGVRRVVDASGMRERAEDRALEKLKRDSHDLWDGAEREEAEVVIAAGNGDAHPQG